MSREVYNSTTLGEIPLSFTGRHLLQNLREAVQNLLAEREEQLRKDPNAWRNTDYWKEISLARGKLAEYMSQLESKSEKLKGYVNHNFGRTQSQEACSPKSKCGDTIYHLPPIPPGYQLEIVGNIITIRPIDKTLEELRL